MRTYGPSPRRPIDSFKFLAQKVVSPSPVAFLTAFLACLVFVQVGCGSGVVTALPGSLLVSSGALDFGDVIVGQKAYSRVTVSNPNSITLDIDKLSFPSSVFSLTGSDKFPLSIAPGSSHTFSVEFLPTAIADYSGQISVTGSGSRQLAQLAAHGRGHGNVQLTAQLSQNESELNFGDVTVNTGTIRTVTLTSTGNSPVTLNPATVTGAGFTVVGNSLSANLNPGQSTMIQVLFHPGSVGPASGQLTIGNNASGGGAIVVALNGTGTVEPGSPQNAQLTVNTESLTFGSVTVHTTMTQSVILTSAGTIPIDISEATVVGRGFSLVGRSLPVTLAPGQSLTLQVRFNPEVIGSAAGQLSIKSNAPPTTTTVALRGMSIAQAIPELVLSAETLSFGNVTVNTETTQSLTLTSVGTAVVIVNSIAITGDGFAVSGASFPITLNPMQSLTLRVQFNPRLMGLANGRLEVDSNSSAAESMQVALIGTSIAAPSPQLTVSAASLSFGNVTVNTSTTQSLTLTSTGTAPVSVNSAVISGSGFVLAGGTLPITLAPTHSLTLQVQFNPTLTGRVNGKLRITSNSATVSTAEIALSGTSIAAPSPQLTVSTGSLSFGSVTVNTSTTQSLTLTSTGTAPVMVNSAVIAGAGFTLLGSTTPVRLAPTQSLTLQVQFNPTATGAASGKLTINSSSSTESMTEVALSGMSVAAPNPQLTVSAGSLSFGNVSVNTSTTQPLTLTSTGTMPVAISAAAISGEGFSLSGGTALPITLAPKQSLTLQVHFNPTSIGILSGQLEIRSTSSTGSSTTISLRGIGIEVASPQLAVSTGSLSFGNVSVNTSTMQSLTITSTGTEPVTVNSAAVIGAGFAVVGETFPVTLAPTQSLTLQVQFSPASTGSVNGKLTINSNSSTESTAEVTLSGTGVAAPTPELTVSVRSLSFGNVMVSRSTTQSLTLTSTGTSPVTVNATTVTGAGFAVVGGIFPITLAPTQSIVLRVQFSPISAGRLSGQLLINSDSSTGDNIVISLRGTGTPEPNPQLTISADSLSFGDVTVNTAATKNLILTSTGTSAVTVTSVANIGLGFTLFTPRFPMILDPTQSVTLQVEFNPTATGLVMGQVTVNSNSTNAGTLVIALNGTGVSPNPKLTLSTGSLSFGSIAVDTSTTKTLTLTSTGTSPLTINSAVVSGTDFTLLGGSFPVTLNPTQSLTLQLRFLPTSAGTQSGQITITSNSTSGNLAVIALSGTGTVAAHEVDLSWDPPTNSPVPVIGYNVYRSVGSSASFSAINPSPVATAVYIDGTVMSGTTYLYIVRSVDGSGRESSPSNQIAITIP